MKEFLRGKREDGEMERERGGGDKKGETMGRGRKRWKEMEKGREREMGM